MNNFKQEINVIPYDEYDKYLAQINPHQFDLSSIIPRELNAIEKSFLKYMEHNKYVDSLYVARYWYYDYNLDVKNALMLFFKMNLLEISQYVDLNSYTVVDLKNILCKKNIPKTWKKQELIQKINNNFSEDELVSILGPIPFKYKLTHAGQEIIKNVPKSATPNYEFEDECIKLILNRDYNSAFMKICNFKLAAPLNSGLGYDWCSAKKRRWNGMKLGFAFKNHKIYRACMIFCNMMGLSDRKIDIIYHRITGEDYVPPNKVFFPKQYVHYDANKRELNDYKKSGIKQYRILSACDVRTCRKCAHMDSKVFNVHGAVIGINFPPFEYKCRCTTVAVLGDSLYTHNESRRVRDENGKSIVVPYMDYKEWSKKYAPQKYAEYFENNMDNQK